MRAVFLILLLSLGFIAMTMGQAEYSYKRFQLDSLSTQRAESERSWLPFINDAHLLCGIYALAAGAKDEQSPHKIDEVYYVTHGKASIHVEGKDFPLKQGSVVFVRAEASHYFHHIEEDFESVVFFSKTPFDEDSPAGLAFDLLPMELKAKRSNTFTHRIIDVNTLSTEIRLLAPKDQIPTSSSLPSDLVYLVVSGNGTLNVNGSSQPLSTGTILHVKPEIYHQIHPKNPMKLLIFGHK